MNRDIYTKHGLLLYLIQVGADQEVIDKARADYEAARLEEQGKKLFQAVFS